MVVTKDSLININPKTAPHRFYRKPQKLENPVGFCYKIQNLGEKIENQVVFWFIDRFLTDFFFKFQILNKNGKLASFLVFIFFKKN
jgi:hypothetical protein